MMRIGILLCDNMEPAFKKAHGEYPDMYRAWLTSAQAELDFNVYDLTQGHFPSDINVCDGYLITGSQYSVYDAIPWIEQLHDFVRLLYVENKKMLGICFGHQLIANALGGRVIKSPHGWGVGISEQQIIIRKPWMQPGLDTVTLCRSHQDQVVLLPDNAEALAGNNFCPYYMLQVGSNVITIQGHPEFSKTYTQALLEKRQQNLGAVCYQQGMQSLSMPVDGLIVAQWFYNFLKS